MLRAFTSQTSVWRHDGGPISERHHWERRLWKQASVEKLNLKPQERWLSIPGEQGTVI